MFIALKVGYFFDANGMRIHGGYDPSAEAELQARHFIYTKNATVFGIGFGYLIAQLLESKNIVTVIGIIMLVKLLI